MKLYLMRHGQAQSKDIDPEQGLSEKGKTEVLQLARKLKARGIHIDRIVHSNKTRARQTAELVQGVVADNAQCNESDDIKPNDDPEKLKKQITDWTVDTLVVSHLPFIPALIDKLSPSNNKVSFETGTMACLEKNGMTWKVLWVENP